MSQTYVAQIVIILAFFLPKIGLTVGNDELTSLVQAVAVLGGVVWAIYRRHKKGDVTLAGFRK